MAEVSHYKWRVRRYRVYAVQDEQMTRFFDEIANLFSLKQIYAMFPELVGEYQQQAVSSMDDSASLFLAIREEESRL